jgi:hypothetical protein
MSESIKASDRIADKIAQIDEEIATAKSETLQVSQRIAQIQLVAGKKRVQELQALKSALEELQNDMIKAEAKQ